MYLRIDTDSLFFIHTLRNQDYLSYTPLLPQGQSLPWMLATDRLLLYQ